VNSQPVFTSSPSWNITIAENFPLYTQVCV